MVTIPVMGMSSSAQDVVDVGGCMKWIALGIHIGKNIISASAPRYSFENTRVSSLTCSVFAEQKG